MRLVHIGKNTREMRPLACLLETTAKITAHNSDHWLHWLVPHRVPKHIIYVFVLSIHTNEREIHNTQFVCCVLVAWFACKLIAGLQRRIIFLFAPAIETNTHNFRYSTSNNQHGERFLIDCSAEVRKYINICVRRLWMF